MSSYTVGKLENEPATIVSFDAKADLRRALLSPLPCPAFVSDATKESAGKIPIAERQNNQTGS